MDQLSPIALFVYDRPDHAGRTLRALQQNKLADQSALYIFADGPRANASDAEKAGIAAVREVVRSQKWCAEVQIIEREQNIGLAASIVSGVTDLVKRHAKVIVLEDDIVTAPGFLTFMNDALDLYEKENKVMHISGYMYPVKKQLPETFFYQVTTCWGWATWARAWEHFRDDAAGLLHELKQRKEVKRFDLDGKRAFTRQLEDNVSGKIRTWAVKWQASVFLKGGLCLHPGRSLVQNIGHDGTGANCYETEMFWHEQLANTVKLEVIPLQESVQVREVMKSYYAGFEPGVMEKAKSRLAGYIPAPVRRLLKKVIP